MAYDISEKYDTVGSDAVPTRGYHIPEGSLSCGERVEKDIIPYEKNIQKYVAMPAMAKKLHIAQEKRMNQIAKDSEHDGRSTGVEMGDKSIGIITSGICYQYVKEALPDVSVLKMGLINPDPEGADRRLCIKSRQTLCHRRRKPVTSKNRSERWALSSQAERTCSPFRVNTART